MLIVAYLERSTIMDATRISDGRIVTLKKVYKRFTPFEESTIRRFSEEPLASDPHNYTIPLYDIIHPPWDESIVFLVMPYFIRIHKHKYATVGEALECFRQLFEVSSMPLYSVPNTREVGCRNSNWFEEGIEIRGKLD